MKYFHDKLRKGASFILVFMIYSFAFPVHIFALPQGGQVVAGQAGAEVLITACPECKMMLDATVEETLDLVELVARSSRRPAQ